MKRAIGFAALFLVLGTPLLAGVQDLVITELVAVNNSTLLDGDGETSDWFEVLNDGPDRVDLEGVFVTDDLMNRTKWVFPAVELDPGVFLVVFASNKDKRDPNAELHTNFRLSGHGESLALIATDGLTVIWQYSPFPALVEDFSYGLRHPIGGSLDRSATRFFPTPTPGQPNGDGFPGVAPAPVLSPPGPLFGAEVTVT